MLASVLLSCGGKSQILAFYPNKGRTVKWPLLQVHAVKPWIRGATIGASPRNCGKMALLDSPAGISSIRLEGLSRATNQPQEVKVMEEKRDRTVLIAVVTGVVALLLGLCLGALVGGVAGYFIGQQAARQPVELEAPPLLPETPTLPEIPVPEFRLPVLPDTTGVSGAWIQEVVPNSPAAKAGLTPRDVITYVDDTALDEEHDLATVLGRYQPGDEVTLTVWRFGETRKVTATLGQHPDDPQRAYLGVKYINFAFQRRLPRD
jgi:hypothetical protein